MYDIHEFGVSDLIRLSAEIRVVGGPSLEDVAGRIVSHLRQQLIDKDSGLPACVLARFYKTHRLGQLPDDVRAFVQAGPGRGMPAETLCLTLLSTTGDRPEWNDRRQSRSHQAIPLPSPQAVRSSPMIHALIAQLGMDVAEVVDPQSILIDPFARDFNVFHIADVRGSPLVPAQDFVKEHGVRSALGFGGTLPGGEIWAVVMFARCEITREVAEYFKTIGLSAAVALVPASGRTFADESDGEPVSEADLDKWRADALHRLLRAREVAILTQTERLESTLIELDVRARELKESQRRAEASEARKSAVIECALDGVITMDAEGRVTEFNPAAQSMFGYSREEACGQPMAELIIPERLRAAHREGLAHYLATGKAKILNQHIEITGLRKGGEEFPVELTVTRVDLPDGLAFSAYVRDQTDIRVTQARLAELAEALQATLLPLTNPEIPGLDLAAYYLSSASFDGEVGGDFYDPFHVSGTTWSVAIGDVCGKGARAAALTSLVRHTIRSGEQHHQSPAETLAEVNRLVLEDRHVQEEARFCTVALARLEVGVQGVTGSLALAGHPLPAIVRAGGKVELVGRPALPLGLFAAFETELVEISLGPGDALILYTDGITEGRVPGGELFGEQRLVGTLEQSAGEPAQTQVEALMAAFKQHVFEPSDDTAVIALRVPA